jgi:hypothetical protein
MYDFYFNDDIFDIEFNFGVYIERKDDKFY